MHNGFLYHNGNVHVSYFRNSVEDHVLNIAGYSIILQRGVLDDLARSTLSGLRAKLMAIDPLFNDLLEKNFVDLTRVGAAVVSARFNERQLEEKAFYGNERPGLSR